MINAIGNYIGKRKFGSSSPNGVPSSLAATVKSDTEIDLTWSSTSTNQDGYRIYISTDKGDNYSLHGISTGLTYPVSDLTPDSYYLFKVTAYKGINESIASNISGIYAGLWYLGGSIPNANVKAAYCPIGKTNLTLSYVNEVNPGINDATPIVAPTFDISKGWLFDGTQSLDTGLIPTNNQTWSMIIEYEGFIATVNEQCLAGTFDSTTKEFRISLGKTTNSNMVFGNGQEKKLNSSYTSAFVAVCGDIPYWMGFALGAISAGSGSITRTIKIGTMNYSTTPWFYAGNIKAVAIYFNTPLTSAQLLKVCYHLHLKHSINVAERIQYVNQKFAAFITWGMATFVNNENPPYYSNVNLWAPTGMNIDQWLDTCVVAGMKAATLTVKELDGWCLWPTTFADPGYSPYGIASTAWYANNGSPDITALFVAGCRARGLKVGFTYSVNDKAHEVRSGTTELTDPESYYQLNELQITELLTNYGDIDYFWIDGWWSMDYLHFPHNRLFNLIRSLQPKCVLPCNDQIQPQLRFDIDTYEVAQVGNVPVGNTKLAEEVQSCRVDGAWWYHKESTQFVSDYVSATDIKTRKDTANSRNALYSLAVLITEEGIIGTRQTSILNELGTL